MKKNVTLLNTARGAVINEPELIETLRERPDIVAVLDVTHPEPPASNSPLFDLPNIILTPHIAGSQFQECRRMAKYMVDDCKRFLDGKPLHHQITRKQASLMA